MSDILRVGIIGANASGGWAGEAHVPAIKGLPGLELAAIATNSRRTADAAAVAFGVVGYDDGRALIEDPTIDIVTVATRVPDHRDLVLAAAAAGKHVYCEWPLGRSRDEAETMRAAVDGAGVHHAIGLQLRASPTARAALDAIGAGRIGRLLTVSAFSSTAGFGPDVPRQFAYLEDPASFANLVTIQGAHTLDLVLAMGGAAVNVAALTSRQFPTIKVEDEEEPRGRETFDHLLAHGILEGGASFNLEVAGGRRGETPFRMELTGEDGCITLNGGAPRGVQSSRVTWSLNGEPQQVDEGDLGGLDDPAANVGGVYAALRRDIVSGDRTVVDFGHAVALTGLVEAMFASSGTGERLAV